MNNRDGVPYNMRCGKRHRLKESGCLNSKSIPKNVIEFVRTKTSLQAVQEALERKQLTTGEKRKLHIEAEIGDIGLKLSRLVAIAQATPDFAELANDMKVLVEKRKALEDELSNLEQGLVEDMERWQVAFDEQRMFSDDPMLLNSLLKMVGYAITVYPDGLIKASNDIYPFKYNGLKRAGNKVQAFKVLYLDREETVSAMQMTSEYAELWKSEKQEKPDDELGGLLSLMKWDNNILRP
jgi:hypothetical protein